MNFHWYFIVSINKFIPKGPIYNIGSDNGLAPIRRQAIIWTNGGLVYWHIYASLGLNELSINFIHFDIPSWSYQDTK